MRHSKSKASLDLIDKLLSETSWLLSHAQALSDYGRAEEAAAELLRAAACEEQVACLLEADGQELEASIHRMSAASCYQKLNQYTRAVTLLRAALSGPLPTNYQACVEQQLANCLLQAKQQLKQVSRRTARKPASAVI